MVKIMIV